MEHVYSGSSIIVTLSLRLVGACDHHRARQTLQWDIECVFAVWASLAGSRPLGNGIGTQDRRLGPQDMLQACCMLQVHCFTGGEGVVEGRQEKEPPHLWRGGATPPQGT